MTEDEVMELIRQHFSEEERKPLVRTVWKDGIDIEIPRARVLMFARACQQLGEKT